METFIAKIRPEPLFCLILGRKFGENTVLSAHETRMRDLLMAVLTALCDIRDHKGVPLTADLIRDNLKLGDGLKLVGS